MMSPRFLYAGIAVLMVACGGCWQSSMEMPEHDTEHENVGEMPSSLGDLSYKVRLCLAELKKDGTNGTVTDELTDLVSWAPEFAAETNIGEERWIPIYDLSEEIRLSILKDGQQWDSARIEQVTHLCELSEMAWESLRADERIARFQGHDHGDHDHDHGDHAHGDHDHGDHDHAHGHDDHDHGDHDHDHGDHDHAHGHDDHSSGAHGNEHGEQVTQ